VIYHITVTIADDLASASAETIAGIKEDLAAYSERYGVVRNVRAHMEEPPQPQQITIGEIVRQAGTAAASKTEPPPETRPPAPPPQKTTKKKKTKTADADNDFTPPTLEEVIQYARERRAAGKGMTDRQAETWYYMKERAEWTWGNEIRHKLKRWKMDFCAWEQYPPGAKESDAAPKGYAPSFNLPAFEQSTLEVPIFEKG